MKYVVPAILILSLSAVFAACGGEEEEPSSQEMCESVCKEANACFDDSGSASGDEDCEEDCEEVIQLAKADGCGDEYDALLSCFDEKFSCAIYEGSGDYPCLDEVEDYTECMDENSGSGS